MIFEVGSDKFIDKQRTVVYIKTLRIVIQPEGSLLCSQVPNAEPYLVAKQKEQAKEIMSFAFRSMFVHTSKGSFNIL
jgi:hypothetical protein